MGGDNEHKGAGKGDGGGGHSPAPGAAPSGASASIPRPIGMASEGVSEAMNEKIMKELLSVFTSEEKGMTTKLKHGLASLNDASLQVLSALDVLGSPFTYDMPVGLGAYKSVDMITGSVTGNSLAAMNSQAVASLPFPVSVFTTIAMDAERLVPFLEFGHRSVVTPKAVRTLCALGAIHHAVGPGNLASLAALGYVITLKEFQGMVVSQTQPGDPIGYLPPELCTPERAILRNSLPTLMLSSVETVSGVEITRYTRLVAICVTGKSVQIPELAAAFLAKGEIDLQSGQSAIGKGKRFMLKFLTSAFACIGRSTNQPLANVFVDAGKNVMEFYTAESMKSNASETPVMPTGVKKRRKIA